MPKNKPHTISSKDLKQLLDWAGAGLYATRTVLPLLKRVQARLDTTYESDELYIEINRVIQQLGHHARIPPLTTNQNPSE